MNSSGDLKLVKLKKKKFGLNEQGVYVSCMPEPEVQHLHAWLVHKFEIVAYCTSAKSIILLLASWLWHLKDAMIEKQVLRQMFTFMKSKCMQGICHFFINSFSQSSMVITCDEDGNKFLR